MASAYCLLLAAALFAGFLSEYFCTADPFSKIADCYKNKLAAAASICWRDQDCWEEKKSYGLKTCLLFGLDLFFQDSTYRDLHDFDTYGLIKHAIEECFEGVKAYRETLRLQSVQTVPGFPGSFYHCLLAARECATSETMWDEK
ncbi:hypothetical protein ANANG_G00137630 [Anguilla anguilla]|uniref:Uncharacterized protein n=1 Tax=Anguilla anguilla TaxID=7936 RepID=A0A9D3RVP8_ANGAN|nr:hypothetical protein ANANG_G00137630 [Anguilla anguilla]